MSMLVATQVTAVATTVLAFFAIVTAWLAYSAWHSQSGEIRRLQGEREEEAEEQRWAQARRVYIDIDVFPGIRGGSPDDLVIGRIARPPAITATVRNVSDRPVYDVRIHWIDLQRPTQAGAEDLLGTVAPGGGKSEIEQKVPDGTPPDKLMPIAYFRDASGKRWTITPNGYLDPVPAGLLPGAPAIGTGAAAQEAGRLKVLAGTDPHDSHQESG
jgi:hypothetical protein